MSPIILYICILGACVIVVVAICTMFFEPIPDPSPIDTSTETNTDTSTETVIVPLSYGMQFDGDGYVDFINSFDGGDVDRDMLSARRAGKVKYKNIVLQRGFVSDSTTFKIWLRDQFNEEGKRVPISGRMIVSNDQGILDITRFEDAACKTVTLPACDGDSKDTAYLTMELDPVATKVIVRGWDPNHEEFKKSHAFAATTQKAWLPSNFRLNIQGLEEDCRFVTRIEPISVEQQVTPDGTVISPSNLVITCPIENGKKFQAWFDESTRRTNEASNDGSTPVGLRKTGSIKFYNEIKSEVMFEVNLTDLDINEVEVLEDATASMCKITMIIGAIRIL
jgi:hypothetical protein